MTRLKLLRRKVVTAPAVVSPINLTSDDARIIHSAERAGFEAWRAFDGNINTFFNNGLVQSNDTYIGWCFDTPKDIVQFRWGQPSTSGYYVTTGWNLEYSDDGVNWSISKAYTSEYYSGQTPEWKSAVLPSVGAHRYWLMRITGMSGAGYYFSNIYFQFVEFWAGSTTYFPP